ncbi:unnamed protein product [Adineta ricciae]|uniref:Uncharacterized protein n=1 Tax=Adineta ricciae TaxID=249248 RepID=A0A815NUQ7_ADIRI|nr:unnamed protein product [Adineta ricciae]CAF1442702.1 unnamed protein product [Adineta ricciae]
MKLGTSGLDQFSITAVTRWLDRFLQIYPLLFQSAMMDGVVNALLGSVSRHDLWTSAIGSQFSIYCPIDVECN